jgi:hypothetical protein
MAASPSSLPPGPCPSGWRTYQPLPPLSPPPVSAHSSEPPYASVASASAVSLSTVRRSATATPSPAARLEPHVPRPASPLPLFLLQSCRAAQSHHGYKRASEPHGHFLLSAPFRPLLSRPRLCFANSGPRRPFLRAQLLWSITAAPSSVNRHSTSFPLNCGAALAPLFPS